MDQEIGKVLDALRSTSLIDNTLVIFTSDHGDLHGAHQLYCKTFPYEEAVRVPLIMSMGGRGVARRVDDSHLVSNGLDLLPTICDYAGVDVPHELEGRSLRPLLEGGQATAWRDHVVAETWLRTIDCEGRMVRSQRYKYVVYSWGQYREQLFGLYEDPGEMVNLAVESRHRFTLDEHRQLLREWCQRTGDSFGRNIHARPEVPLMVPGSEYPSQQVQSAPVESG